MMPLPLTLAAEAEQLAVTSSSEPPSPPNPIQNPISVLIGESAWKKLGYCNWRDFSNLKAAHLAAARLTESQARRVWALQHIPEMAVFCHEQTPQVSSPGDAAALLIPLLNHLEQEYLYVLLLSTRNRLIGQPIEVYHGSLNTSLIRVGEVFRDAVKVNAAGIIVAHNHPSGDPSPSPEDVAVTSVLVETGKMLDVDLLDHLVIAGGRFISLKERGLGFGS